MSRPVAWLGGDPGMGGAIALFLPETNGIEVEDMPAHEVDGKRRMDLWRLAHILGAWSSTYFIKSATVERVHSMPSQGVASSFSFGFSAGALQQALASADIPMTLIHPATWKAIYGLRGGRENKDMSRRKASEIFPSAAHLWARKKDEGRAEAVLLAHYGSKLK